MARTFSLLGSGVLSVATTIYIIQSGGSASLVASAVALAACASIVGRNIGSLADVVNPIVFMVGSSVVGVAACAAVLVPGTSAGGEVDLWVVAATLIISELCSSAFSVSEYALVTRLYPVSMFGRIFSLMAVRGQVVTLTGSVASGLLYTVSPLTPWVAGAAAFLISGVTAMILWGTTRRTVRRLEPATKTKHPVQRIFRGYQLVMSDPFLRPTSLCIAAANFALAGAGVLTEVKVVSAGLSPDTIGLLFAAVNGAGILGALVAGRVDLRRFGVRAALVVCLLVMGMTFVGVGLVSSPYAVVAVLSIGVAVLPFVAIIVVTRQASYMHGIDPHAQGRFAAAVSSLDDVANAVGPGAFGALSRWLGVSGALITAGGVCGAWSSVPALNRRVGRYDV